MAWRIEAIELDDGHGGESGRWRLCATSDNDGGFQSDESHDHASPEAAHRCKQCREYVAGVTGIPLKPSPLGTD